MIPGARSIHVKQRTARSCAQEVMPPEAIRLSRTAFRIPHSAFIIHHSSFIIPPPPPHSSFRTHHSSLPPSAGLACGVRLLLDPMSIPGEVLDLIERFDRNRDACRATGGGCGSGVCRNGICPGLGCARQPQSHRRAMAVLRTWPDTAVQSSARPIRCESCLTVDSQYVRVMIGIGGRGVLRASWVRHRGQGKGPSDEPISTGENR